MSIIYDALQKTQRNREIKMDKPISNQRNYTWLDKILFMIIALLIVILLFAYVPRWMKHTAPMVASVPATENATPVVAANGDVVLNGVFVADEEKVALINNKTFHLGDSVQGMKIIGINDSSVILQNGSHRLVLQLPG